MSRIFRVEARSYSGGKYAYNDFCGNIFWKVNVSVDYIGKAILTSPPPGYEKLNGTLVSTGCSMCYEVSMGLIPSPQPRTAQFDNIDCLACHADPSVYMAGTLGFKMNTKLVYQDEKGVFKYMVNPNISITTIAKSIRDKPLSTNCLSCHAYSGGGPGVKRPNPTPDLPGNVGRDFDVHMAAGLQCIDCHKGEAHAFPTKSADTWNREEGVTPSCTMCHGTAPHSGLKGWILNTFHMERVSCQVCHIPYVNDGNYPADVHRNWSAAELSEKAGRYEPEITLEKSVVPVYAWYNGARQVYIYPEQSRDRERRRTNIC